MTALLAAVASWWRGAPFPDPPSEQAQERLLVALACFWVGAR